MKKLFTIIAVLIIGYSVLAQIRVTEKAPDPNHVYEAPEEVLSERKTPNSLAGLYRMSETIYTNNEKTTFSKMEADYMMKITEVVAGNYIATIYGHLKYKERDIDCGTPSALMFTITEDGVETSRQIIKEGNCKLQKPHDALRVGWQLDGDSLILTKSAGDECIVGPCGKLNRVVYIQKFDKTN